MDKEAYFTTEGIEKKAGELLSSVSWSRPRHNDLRFNPRRSALLVLDMQAYFLDPHSHAFIPSAPAIVPGLVRLAEAFRRIDRPIILTRHENTRQNAGMMARWWHDLPRPRSAHSHLQPQFAAFNAPILPKSQYDAFYGTDLEHQLHESGIQQVVISGVMTHLCCECTARSAFIRGYEVYFAVDGTATYNEELHRASLLTLSHGFALPVVIAELISEIDSYGH